MESCRRDRQMLWCQDLNREIARPGSNLEVSLKGTAHRFSAPGPRAIDVVARCGGRGKAMSRALRLANGRKARRAPGVAEKRCAVPLALRPVRNRTARGPGAEKRFATPSALRPARYRGTMRPGLSGLRRSADMRLLRHRRRRGPSPRPREGRRRLSPSRCGGRRTRTRAHP